MRSCMGMFGRCFEVLSANVEAGVLLEREGERPIEERKMESEREERGTTGQ